MNRLKYDYKRVTVTARISDELYAQLREACEVLGVSRQDFITHALLFQLDPTGMLLDNLAISRKLSNTLGQ